MVLKLFQTVSEIHFNMRHILVPTDFSENAWNALKYGIELFKKTNCTFYLMHVNPVTGYSGSGTSLKKSSAKLADILIENSLKNLQALIDELEKLPLNNNHTFLPLVFYGYFTDTVNRVVKDKNIDLILMGTKGATGLKKATIGSNTGDVITKVKCPLLALPENAVYEKLKEIAFPTDFRFGNDFNALDTLLELVKINDAS
jgi:nucleotide-binding universal stress UspA family protein